MGEGRTIISHWCHLIDSNNLIVVALLYKLGHDLLSIRLIGAIDTDLTVKVQEPLSLGNLGSVRSLFVKIVLGKSFDKRCNIVWHKSSTSSEPNSLAYSCNLI